MVQTLHPGTNELQMDLTSGMYILKLQGTQSKTIKKLVIH